METIERVGDRYRLRARLASGGMGDVWAGEDELLGRPVALKLLRPDLARDGAFRQRFRTEAQAAARLSHPGVVAVYDYGEDAGTAYLVMELVHGEALSAIVRRRGRLTVAETMSVVAQTAVALAAAHDEGLIHRDVKPANLLVRPDGRVKVTDFGIVRAADTATVTDVGTVLGTVAYMAPEQIRGQRVTAATDLYSLGVVAHECLTGQRPFAGEDSIAVALAHVQNPAPTLPATVPAPVRELLASLMAKDPAGRPATAARVAEVAGRLAVAPDAVVAGGDGPPTASWRPAFGTGDGRGVGIAPTALLAGIATAPAVPEAGTASMAAAANATEQATAGGPRLRARAGSGRAGWPARLEPQWIRWALVAALALLVAIVLLVTTDGAGSVTVPDVKGQAVATAVSLLDRIGLRPVRATVDAAGARAGTVVAERPGADHAVAAGSRVRLTVASGYVDLRAGSLDKLTAATASTRLAHLGLVVTTDAAESATVPVGEVVSFSPSGRLGAGTTVVLIVSTGSPPTTTTTAPPATTSTGSGSDAGPGGGQGGGGPGPGGGPGHGHNHGN